MKYFPKKAKTKKFAKRIKKISTKKEEPLLPTDLNEGFDFRKEFDLLLPTMYKKLSSENAKKLWLISSSLIIKNIGSQENLRQQLKTAIEQAHKILFK